MSTERLLRQYRSTFTAADRLSATQALIGHASTNRDALDALYYVLNEEGDSKVRLEIMTFLRTARPHSAIRVLTKGMFDPEKSVRAQAALGLADYNDARLLAGYIGPLLDALPDPVTRSPAERAVRLISGKASDNITVSERERVRLDEHPETIWPNYWAGLP